LPVRFPSNSATLQPLSELPCNTSATTAIPENDPCRLEPPSFRHPYYRADDLLEGAEEIGDFMFPNIEDPVARRRRVYRLTSEVKPTICSPCIGSDRCSSRDGRPLMRWIAERKGKPAT